MSLSHLLLSLSLSLLSLSTIFSFKPYFSKPFNTHFTSQFLIHTHPSQLSSQFLTGSTKKMKVLENKLLNIGLPVLVTLVVAKLVSLFLNPRSPTRRLPPVIATWPVIGGLVRFLKGPVAMIREEYPKLGSVFTLKLLNKKITFLIGPEVSAHFFNGFESDMSQQEVYRFNVPTFGPGVVYDVDYSVRQEQFRFFTESLRVSKLKGYVDQVLMEAQVLGF
ncbi:sterol 14-demethylase-like [Rhododendron vialii]|uniref:sterol 14-demethylase-like n=1 Tax=Rhododendron vialii TaxID=182163 RepID=UPI00265F67D2|nr:sterol 14-demethylase-like [Rhododendron vialii]